MGSLTVGPRWSPIPWLARSLGPWHLGSPVDSQHGFRDLICSRLNGASETRTLAMDAMDAMDVGSTAKSPSSPQQGPNEPVEGAAGRHLGHPKEEMP